jgi:hypothetical protein
MAERQVLRIPPGDHFTVHKHSASEANPISLSPVKDISENRVVHIRANREPGHVPADPSQPDPIQETRLHGFRFKRGLLVSSERAQKCVCGPGHAPAQDRAVEVLRQQVQPLQLGRNNRCQLHGRNDE